MRLDEAKVLLDAGKWAGAYYLAGYAVECALKACVARLMQAEVFPDKDFAVKCYTHNLEALLALAGLSRANWTPQ
jgi:HEPN domain-containing protein